jgi:hypothetical protein
MLIFLHYYRKMKYFLFYNCSKVSSNPACFGEGFTRSRFKLGGKNMYVIGRYPELSLETARKENKKKGDRDKSFERVVLEWIKQKRRGSSKPHTEAAIRTLENTVFSQIGP